MRACQILGGPDQLAVRLGMSHLLVKAMLKGTLVPPPPVFLKVVDILMAFDGRDTGGRQPDSPGHTRPSDIAPS